MFMSLKTKNNFRNWQRSLTRATQKQRRNLPLKEKVDWLKAFLKKSPQELFLVHFPNKVEYCNYLFSEMNQIQSTVKMDASWKRTRLMNVEIKIDKLKECLTNTKKVKKLVQKVPNVPLKTGFPLRLKNEYV